MPNDWARGLWSGTHTRGDPAGVTKSSSPSGAGLISDRIEPQVRSGWEQGCESKEQGCEAGSR